MDDFEPDDFDRAFYTAYWGWLFYGQETRPLNEAIERVYRRMQKHTPKACPHGKTALTCGDCYFSGWGQGG